MSNKSINNTTKERPNFDKYNFHKLSFFDKIKGFLSSPTATFKKVKNEEYTLSLKYYIILYIAIYAILSVILSTIIQFIITPSTSVYANPYTMFFRTSSTGVINKVDLSITFFIVSIIIGFVFSIISGLIGYFLGGIWINLWVYILGGRKGFSQTLKAYGYGQTPNLIFGWIPLFGWIFSIWSFVLVGIGIRELHEISTGKAIAAILLAIFIPIIIMIIIAAMVYSYVSGFG